MLGRSRVGRGLQEKKGDQENKEIKEECSRVKEAQGRENSSSRV